MKNKSFFTTLLAIMLVFGLALIGCGDGSGGGDGTGDGGGGSDIGIGGGGSGGGGGGGSGGGGGTLTITDIPSQYNGKYALFINEHNPTIVGLQNYDIPTDTYTMVQISNGKVNLPVWTSSGSSIVRYSGNDTVSGDTILYILTSQTMQGHVEKPDNRDLVVAGIGFIYPEKPIAFSNGSATVSANIGTLFENPGTGGGDPTPTAKYIITGSGTTFTAKKGDTTVGTADKAIGDVIGYIRTDANGANIEIQFGNGTAVLDIGTAYIVFTGSTWGSITLSGKVTSASTQPTIKSYVSIISTADIKNTLASGSECSAVHNTTGGTFTVNGGTISAIYDAIENYGDGAVTINGGTVFSTGSNKDAIHSGSTLGTVIVNGGTIEARGEFGSGIVCYNTITITGGTIAVTNNNGSNAITNGGTLTISNGTIKTANTNTNTSAGSAIRNGDNSTATITGGTIQAATCNAIENRGTMTISGGTIQSSGTNASPANRGSTILNFVNQGSSGILTINGGTVKNTSTGYAVYNGLPNGSNKGTVTIGAGATITGDTFGVN